MTDKNSNPHQYRRKELAPRRYANAPLHPTDFDVEFSPADDNAQAAARAAYEQELDEFLRLER